jgi:hypothetical protein
MFVGFEVCLVKTVKKRRNDAYCDCLVPRSDGMCLSSYKCLA